jgi:DNA-directed RNA polymerase subunit RPC12/RpoP
MALRSFCSTCGRTVYIDEEDTPMCPVCSSPLLETVEETSEETQAAEGGA